MRESRIVTEEDFDENDYFVVGGPPSPPSSRYRGYSRGSSSQYSRDNSTGYSRGNSQDKSAAFSRDNSVGFSREDSRYNPDASASSSRFNSWNSPRYDSLGFSRDNSRENSLGYSRGNSNRNPSFDSRDRAGTQRSDSITYSGAPKKENRWSSKEVSRNLDDDISPRDTGSKYSTFNRGRSNGDASHDNYDYEESFDRGDYEGQRRGDLGSREGRRESGIGTADSRRNSNDNRRVSYRDDDVTGVGIGHHRRGEERLNSNGGRNSIYGKDSNIGRNNSIYGQESPMGNGKDFTYGSTASRRDNNNGRRSEDRYNDDNPRKSGTNQRSDRRTQSTRDDYENDGRKNKYQSDHYRDNGFGRGGSKSSGRPNSLFTRQTSRVVYDGEADLRDRETEFQRSQSTPLDRNEKAFLGKVQRELENQRLEWKDEIDRLTAGSVLSAPGTSSFDASKNSLVDTSGAQPLFKAFVDVSEFPASSVKVNVDKLNNKVVVEAESTGQSGMAKTFTQKVQLPRYADDDNLIARINKQGILKVEVPLIYYFPDVGRNDSAKAKSFVYEVRTDPDGRKTMEILVSTGKEVNARDLRVEVEGDKLQVLAEKTRGSVGSLSPGEEGHKTLIKQYTMPPNADTEGIQTHRTKDGRLAILIPIY